MLDKILKRFGYIREDSVTEDYMLGRLIGSPIGVSISKEEDQAFFDSFKSVEHGKAYLKATVAKDILRYYGATDEKERNIIQGAARRTIYFLSKLK